MIPITSENSSNVHCNPGRALPHATLRLDYASSNIFEYLMKVRSRGAILSTTAEREIVRDVKKKLHYIAVDFDSEMKSASESLTTKRLSASVAQESILSHTTYP